MRGKVFLRAGAVLIGFGLGVVLSLWLVLWVSLRSNAVRVPNVTGLEPARAVGELQALGLVGRLADGVFSADVSPGRVAIQRPASGFQLKRGSTVLLQPSLGKASVRLDDLAGLPLSLAETQLEESGLTVGRRCEVSGEADAVVVLASMPPGGSRVAPASAVSLLYNAAPRRVRYVMPDFVGTDERSAASIIASLGFRLATVQRVAYPGAQPDLVLRQEPAAGGPVTEAAVVALWVSQ